MDNVVGRTLQSGLSAYLLCGGFSLFKCADDWLFQGQHPLEQLPSEGASHSAGAGSAAGSASSARPASAGASSVRSARAGASSVLSSSVLSSSAPLSNARSSSADGIRSGLALATSRRAATAATAAAASAAATASAAAAAAMPRPSVLRSALHVAGTEAAFASKIAMAGTFVTFLTVQLQYGRADKRFANPLSSPLAMAAGSSAAAAMYFSTHPQRVLRALGVGAVVGALVAARNTQGGGGAEDVG